MAPRLPRIPGRPAPAPAARSGSTRISSSSGRGGKARGGPARPKRTAQIRQAYSLTASVDPKLPLLLVGPALGVLAVFVLIGVLIDHPIYLTILGILLALMTAMAVLGKRTAKASYAQVEGRPGAAAAVLQSMRGDWNVTPVVAVNKAQDLVHRAVGRPGVVLIGEGNPQRVSQLIVQEKRRVQRVLPDVPVYDVVVGNETGQVPVPKLYKHLTKLPRNMSGSKVVAVESRLKALGSNAVPIPKGPIPRGGRAPRHMR